MSMLAKTNGECTYCHGSFDAGEQVKRTEEDGYAHISCNEDLTKDVCEKCWLVHQSPYYRCDR